MIVLLLTMGAVSGWCLLLATTAAICGANTRLRPDPAAIQAIQDAPAVDRPGTPAARVALMTDAEVRAAVEAMWAAADFDQAAGQACHLTDTEDQT